MFGGGTYGKEKSNNNKKLGSEYLTYVASVGDDKDSVEVRYEDENIWLTQKMLSVLYDVEKAQ